MRERRPGSRERPGPYPFSVVDRVAFVDVRCKRSVEESADRGGGESLRPYEILVIIDPRPTDEEAAALLTQLGEQITALGADVTKVDNWGKRRLAYEIRKQREGTYAVLEVSAESSTIKEFERQLKLNENVLRYLSTRVPIRKRVRPGKGEPVKTDDALEEVG